MVVVQKQVAEVKPKQGANVAGTQKEQTAYSDKAQWVHVLNRFIAMAEHNWKAQKKATQLSDIYRSRQCPYSSEVQDISDVLQGASSVHCVLFTAD
jgi:hypothetical protein